MTLLSFYNPEMEASRRSNGFDLSNFFGNRYENEKNASQSNYPAVNIIEEPEQFRIEVAAPGYSKEDFKININNDVLQVGVEKERNEVEGESYTRCEFYNGVFKREFIVGKSVDTSKIEARYENGILTILLGKREVEKPKQPRTIDID